MTREHVAGPPLTGSWRLERWVAVADDGSETHPMGEAPDGLLTYAPDGTMITVLGRSDRPAFATADLTGGSVDERAAAFGSFVAYGGRWTLDGDHVVHAVETSLFPNWVGSTQRRHWQLIDGGARLVLTAPPLEVAGTTRVQRLTWARLGPSRGERPPGEAP